MKENLVLEFAIFALIGVGFLVRKLNIVSEPGQKSITNLVVNVILPCNIIKAFLTADVDQIRDDGLWVFGISLVFHFFCIVYGRLQFRKPPESERNCLRFAALCSNAGFMGNPVAEGLYGLTGLALANVYLIPMRTLMWSTGIAIFSGSHDWKGTVKKVLTHPCIIAVELGVLGMLLHIELPELIIKPVSYFSSCNTAMSMLVIGMILARIEPKQFMDKTVLLFSVHRLIILPVLLFVACSLLPVSVTARNVSVILAAMPVAANTSILADKYDANPVYATKLVVVSTLLSIPTTALWSFILMR
ncbi:MAG: AEC family transporter [Oscillospiraceae bacterium]|nr:AEC family transporter [Oscillospiraceae bacterium]